MYFCRAMVSPTDDFARPLKTSLKMSHPYTIIDMEYTGGSPYKDRMIALALVQFDGAQVVDRFYSLIYTEAEVSDFLLSMMPFNREELEAAPTFEELAEPIINFIGKSILVGFDVRRLYALLKQAFKRAGRRFNRQQICLRQLVERQFPITHPRTLTAICHDFEIPFEHHSGLLHRCETIAAVTNCLFAEIPHIHDKKQVRQIVQATKFPPNLPMEKVDQLPHLTGVYYFLNSRGQIIYLGKSKDIRTRVLSHFNSDLYAGSKQRMKEMIYDLQYRVTGSELLALLLESDEIKRYMPKFNRAQRRKQYRFGVYARTNKAGYLILELDYLRSEKRALVQFSKKWGGIHFLLQMALQYDLTLSLCGIGSFEHWFTSSGFEEELFRAELETVAAHNAKMEGLIDFFSYPHPNMLIVEDGTDEAELGMVLIEDHKYQGYTYWPRVKAPNLEQTALSTFERLTILPKIRNHLIPFRENPDVQQIIRRYLRKKGTDVKVLCF